MKQTVVVADGDEKFRAELVEALKGCDGFAVAGVAVDGAQAIQIIGEKRPDILVLDLLLTQLDGLTVLERIRSLWYHPKVLLTSGFVSEYVVASAARLGVQQFIHKPCSVDLVIQTLHQMGKDGKHGPIIFPGKKKKQ